MGISKIRLYGEYKGIPIFRDYNVVDEEQVYIGNGQGCDTFWFKSVRDAKRFIDKYRDKMKPNAFGLGLIPRSLCMKCRSHYPFGTEEWKRYPDNVCEELKNRLKREALET